MIVFFLASKSILCSLHSYQTQYISHRCQHTVYSSKDMKSLHLLLILTSALILISCDKSKEETTISIDVKEPEISWVWTDFPQSSELKLRNMPVDIQPKQSFEIKSEAAGIMTFMITDKTTTVKKGTIISKMDVDTLTETEKRIQIQKEKRVLEEMKEIELEQPEQQKKAKKELAEAKRKVKLLEKILTSPAMAEISDELFSNLGEVSEKALTIAREELAFAEKKFIILEEVDQKIRDGQTQLQDMDMAKTERQHQDVKDRSIYTAPFDGELRLEVNYVESQEEYTVSARETIATINDYEEIHAHLKVANAKWVNLQPERLYISLNDKNKTLMNFHDDRIDRDQRTRKEERKYIFSIPLKNNESLKRLAGTQMQGELIYKLPETCYIIPKYDLSLYALGKTESLDWNTMVKQLWPSAEILAEGRKHLAIKY